MIQAASVTGSGQADELRQEMTDGLVAEGWITSPQVEAAFRAVPRHVFMPPGTPLETAYRRAPRPGTEDARGRGEPVVGERRRGCRRR